MIGASYLGNVRSLSLDFEGFQWVLVSCAIRYNAYLMEEPMK